MSKITDNGPNKIFISFLDSLEIKQINITHLHLGDLVQMVWYGGKTSS